MDKRPDFGERMAAAGGLATIASLPALFTPTLAACETHVKVQHRQHSRPEHVTGLHACGNRIGQLVLTCPTSSYIGDGATPVTMKNWCCILKRWALSDASSTLLHALARAMCFGFLTSWLEN